MSHNSAALAPAITTRSRPFYGGKFSALIRFLIGALMLSAFYSTSCSRAFVHAAPSVSASQISRYYFPFLILDLQVRNVAARFVHSGPHGKRHHPHALGQKLDYAFAFDIDGVLMLGKKPIPAAQRALKILEHRKIPYIQLTNGGGKLERERTAELSDKLGVPVYSLPSLSPASIPFLLVVSFVCFSLLTCDIRSI